MTFNINYFVITISTEIVLISFYKSNHCKITSIIIRIHRAKSFISLYIKYV